MKKGVTILQPIHTPNLYKVRESIDWFLVGRILVSSEISDLLIADFMPSAHVQSNILSPAFRKRRLFAEISK